MAKLKMIEYINNNLPVLAKTGIRLGPVAKLRTIFIGSTVRKIAEQAIQVKLGPPETVDMIADRQIPMISST